MEHWAEILPLAVLLLPALDVLILRLWGGILAILRDTIKGSGFNIPWRRVLVCLKGKMYRILERSFDPEPFDAVIEILAPMHLFSECGRG